MADSQPTILGLGPTSGTFPHLVPELDANYDLDDGMTFIRMWSWSLERWGLEPLVSPNIGTPINWDKLMVEIPREAIAGQVYLRYNPNQGKVDLHVPLLEGGLQRAPFDALYGTGFLYAGNLYRQVLDFFTRVVHQGNSQVLLGFYGIDAACLNQIYAACDLPSEVLREKDIHQGFS